MASESRGTPRWWQDFQRRVFQAELAIRQGHAQTPVRAFLVFTHEAAVTHHIGVKDGYKLSW